MNNFPPTPIVINQRDPSGKEPPKGSHLPENQRFLPCSSFFLVFRICSCCLSTSCPFLRRSCFHSPDPEPPPVHGSFYPRKWGVVKHSGGPDPYVFAQFRESKPPFFAFFFFFPSVQGPKQGQNTMIRTKNKNKKNKQGSLLVVDQA